MLQIHNLIIHNIIKKQHDKEIKSKVRPTEIKVLETHNVFFEKLLKIYYNKSNPAYGVFDKNTTNYPYQTLVDNFLDNKNTFKDFTEYSMHLLINRMKMKTGTTGGFFLVCNFSSNGTDFLATIMLNNTTNYDIDEVNLDIVEKMTLDIDKVDVANIINLNKRRANSNTYLSFTKGRKQISEYFIEFIGCTKITDSKHYSSNLKRAINDFLIIEKYDDDLKASIKMKAHSILYQKKKTYIDLDEFCNALFPVNPDNFRNHVSKEEYEVTSNFKCDMNTFKDYQSIFFESPKLHFSFDRNLLDGETIVYDRDEKSLKFKNLAQSVINQIEQIDESNIENS